MASTSTDIHTPAWTIERASDAVRSAAPGLDEATVEAVVVGVFDEIRPTVTFHQHHVSKLQAEGAVEVVAAKCAEATRLRQILKLDGPGRGFVANSIDLGTGTWIVEVGEGPFADRAPFVVIFDSKDTHTFHTSLDEALLYAIELRAGGDPDRGGYRFAARALGVRTTFDDLPA